jgi:hypothetical protein
MVTVMADLSRVQQYNGVDYTDISDLQNDMLSAIHTHGTSRKWEDTLIKLRLPLAICRFTKPGCIQEDIGNASGRKSVWVPSAVWQSIVNGQAIRVSDIPPIEGLVAPDGFVNLRKLCGLNSKRSVNVKNSKAFQEFESALTAMINAQAMQVRDGQTWIHRRLADFVAFQISTQFALQATLWIDLATQQIKGVAEEHQLMLERAASETTQKREGQVRDRLCQMIGGQAEVTTGSTRADIITQEAIVEVKHATTLVAAAQAIGQVGFYRKIHTNKAKKVHLFGNRSEIERCRSSQELIAYAADCDVELSFEIDLR